MKANVKLVPVVYVGPQNILSLLVLKKGKIKIGEAITVHSDDKMNKEENVLKTLSILETKMNLLEHLVK